MAQRLTAGEVIKRIRDHVGAAWISPSSEGFQRGSQETEVSGIVTTWTPTLEVLSRAVSLKHNLVISVEPPFWRETGPVKTEVAYGSPPPEVLEKDAAYQYKQKWIDEHNLILWRFNENYKALPSNPRLNALADLLRWSSYKDAMATQKHSGLCAGVYALPETPLLTLAKEAATRTSAKALRTLGDPAARIKRVALLPGYITNAHMMSLTNDRDIDAVMCGEACQWEAFEYAEDWITQGWGKAFIMLGVAASEDPGGKAIARWLQTFLTGIPSTGIADGEPYNFVVAHEGMKGAA